MSANGDEGGSCTQSEETAAQHVSLGLSHHDALLTISEKVEIILRDPLLRDIPADPTLEEVKSSLLLEQGRAITVNVVRQDEQRSVIPVVVSVDATVNDLKIAIQLAMATKFKREGGPQHFSWKYVWKTYWLIIDGEKLTNEKALLKTYGIMNNLCVTFMKRLRRK